MLHPRYGDVSFFLEAWELVAKYISKEEFHDYSDRNKQRKTFNDRYAQRPEQNQEEICSTL